MQNRFKPSELELHGTRNGLEIGLRSSRGVLSAPLFSQAPDLPTTRGLRGSEVAESRNRKPRSAVLQS
eukprot:2291023-Alexandrium_andersonii.AAC.1